MLRALEPLGVPWVVHGGNPAHSMPSWVDWKFRLLSRALPVRRLPVYACCSRFVADSFESSGYLRQFRRVVIPNGVEMPPGVPPAPRKFSANDRCVIGMLARLDEIKDHRTLLQAFAMVAPSWPGARLELAGDGNLRVELEALSRELRISDRVEFLGMVTDVYKVMRGWDIFAYATTDREGLGNALAEAMMLGLPCVATDVGPIHEVAGDSPATALVPPNNPTELARALLGLLADHDRRCNLAVAARNRAIKEFSPTVFAERYVQLLADSAVDAPGRITSAS